MALGRNAVVAAMEMTREDGLKSDWNVSALSTRDGRELWKKPLVARPGGEHVKAVSVDADHGAFCQRAAVKQFLEARMIAESEPVRKPTADVVRIDQQNAAASGGKDSAEMHGQRRLAVFCMRTAYEA